MSATRCRGTAPGSTGSSLRREAFVRWPVHGNVLEALRDGRLEIGAAHAARAQRLDHRAGRGADPDRRRARFLNIGVMVAALELVEIGEHCMLANGCFVSDGSAPLRRSRTSRSPGRASRPRARRGSATTAGCGANVVITSGVTIGERCVIGANSVVTADIPPFSIAAGAPARVLRTIEYP